MAPDGFNVKAGFQSWLQNKDTLLCSQHEFRREDGDIMAVNLKRGGGRKKTREMHQTFIYSGHIFVKIIENDIIAHFSRKIAFMYFKSCENQGVEKSY